MARVLFIQPPYNSDVEKILELKSPPLGLAYLASVLRDEHEVKIIDAPTLEYGMKEIGDEIKKYDPEIVGISASSTPSIYRAEEVANLAKEINPNCKVVMGGIHPTFMDEETLAECRGCDFIVRGEGELTTKELFSKYKNEREFKQIHGITYRSNGKIVRNSQRELADLDKIPLPARDLLPMERYKMGKYKFGTIISSRGCPFNCIFCSSSRLFGRRWRGRKAELVLEEIKELYDEYDVKYIEFLDDTFTLNDKRALEIGRLIRKEGFDINFDCSSRVDTLKESLVKILSRAGLERVYLGIESGSQKILDSLRKGVTLNQIKDAVKLLKKYG